MVFTISRSVCENQFHTSYYAQQQIDHCFSSDKQGTDKRTNVWRHTN
jgi:hypothetical protein